MLLRSVGCGAVAIFDEARHAHSLRTNTRMRFFIVLFVLPSFFLLASGDAPCLSWSIDAREAAFETAPYFASFNIDPSRNRGFFTLPLGSSSLIDLARGLGDASAAVLRFGGTGGNALFYGNGAGAGPCPPTRPGDVECLNATLWEDVATLSVAAHAPVVFGTNMFPNNTVPSDRHFDASNARAFFSYARARGDNIFGVELGNELNGGLVTAAQQARGLLVLDAALADVYGSDPRPRLLGPDALGVHTPTGGGGWLPTATILEYMCDFLGNVTAGGGNLFAVTHHEYIEVNETSVRDPATLDLTAELAALVVAAVRRVSAAVQVWAGEIGPHNGGGTATSPPNCGGNKLCGRFGSALWYADAMGAKARAGYAVFARQDFIGADYGLVNYTSLAPTPDYWLLLLWRRLVGTRVLTVQPPADARTRVHAFCGTDNHTITLVIINIDAVPACLQAPGLADPRFDRLHFTLTAAGGEAGGDDVTAPGAQLNGAVLAIGNDGELPAMPGLPVPATVDINLPPTSITLVNFRSPADACGGPEGFSLAAAN